MYLLAVVFVYEDLMQWQSIRITLFFREQPPGDSQYQHRSYYCSCLLCYLLIWISITTKTMRCKDVADAFNQIVYYMYTTSVSLKLQVSRE